MVTDWQRRRAKLVLSGTNRIRFYEVLKLQIASGRDLEPAIRNIHDVYTYGGKRYHAFGVLASDCLESLSLNKEGNLLPDVFLRWFSAEEAAALEAGMRTDSLVSALDSLIRLIKDLQSIRSTIIAAALAPFAAFMAISALLGMISIQLIPLFTRILPPDKATGSLAITYSMADFVTRYGVVFLISLILLFIVALWSQPRWTGVFRRAADYFPPWNLYRLMQGSVFLLNLSTLVSTRMSFNEALNMLNRNGDRWLQERLEPTIYHFSNGQNLGTALELSGHQFPSRELILHLKALSQGEGVEQAIRNLAEWWLLRARHIARGMLYLSMVISVVMVFGCMGIMASSMMSLRTLVHI